MSSKDDTAMGGIMKTMLLHFLVLLITYGTAIHIEKQFCIKVYKEN